MGNNGELGFLFQASLDGDASAYKMFLLEVALRAREKIMGCESVVTERVEQDVQMVLFAVHQKRHTYSSGENFSDWLYSIIEYCLKYREISR